MSWRRSAYRAVRPLLFAADPEAVHHVTLRILATGVGRVLAPIASGAPRASSAPVELAGLRFRNRIGLGAGFDKDGVAIRGWAALGFGFVELGTVTPRPQPGNPKPRLFRLADHEALINRMGFNNLGADALARRIATARPHLPPGFVVGVNIGRNRDGDESDYAAAAAAVADVSDYLAINVSSPNTPGLRDLQDPTRLVPLLDSVALAAPDRPLFVKLSPDLEEAERDELIVALLGSPATGLILSNTTVARPGIDSPEAGGLSGRPLLPGTLDAVARARFLAGGRLTIAASGGIGAAEEDLHAVEDEHADLIQVWTGLVYAGPGLIGEAVNIWC